MGIKTVLLFAAAVGLAVAAPINLTGTWKLNVNDSSWGKKERPTSVILTIDHHEPKLRISGTVAEANDSGNHFAFDGAIDGKSYESNAGQTFYKRIDDRTVESSFRSKDGRYTEKATTKISRDGRRLTREIEVTRPDGRLKWTEVYDKQD
ncbi:MAG TPA: hypothetical protein VN428_10535 [Bryobacteraceae bacterium]|nr:hypothetical protein [Bryobacteraceae bacterium]